MSKDLKSMKDHELDAYKGRLEGQRRSNWPKPGYTYPDAYYRVVEEQKTRMEDAISERRKRQAKAREEECEANKNAQMHELTISAIRPRSAHELNN